MGYLSCPLCENGSLYDVADLQKRVAAALARILVCPICSAKVDGLQALHNHLAKHLPSTPIVNYSPVHIHTKDAFNCDRSSDFVPPLEKLEIRDDLTTSTSVNSTHSDSFNIPHHNCEFCGLMFSSEYFLKLHTDFFHSQSQTCDITCKICKNKSKTLSDYKDHVKKEHIDRKYLCEKCPKTFKMKGSLLVHTRMYHDPSSLSICMTCNKVFNTKAKKQIHDKRFHSSNQNAKRNSNSNPQDSLNGEKNCLISLIEETKASQQSQRISLELTKHASLTESETTINSSGNSLFTLHSNLAEQQNAISSDTAMTNSKQATLEECLNTALNIDCEKTLTRNSINEITVDPMYSKTFYDIVEPAVILKENGSNSYIFSDQQKNFSVSPDQPKVAYITFSESLNYGKDNLMDINIRKTKPILLQTFPVNNHNQVTVDELEAKDVKNLQFAQTIWNKSGENASADEHFSKQDHSKICKVAVIPPITYNPSMTAQTLLPTQPVPPCVLTNSTASRSPDQQNNLYTQETLANEVSENIYKNESNLLKEPFQTSDIQDMLNLKKRAEGDVQNGQSASSRSPGNTNKKDLPKRPSEGKQWECDECKKSFTTKYFLKKHRRLHTGETPYACNECGKTFTFQQSYHKHILYHTDDKPHVCGFCGRAFKEMSTLHNHVRIHTGEKPFTCDSCGKAFRQRVSYLVHQRIHTGVMPYKCELCNKSFRYKVSLRSHKCDLTPQLDSNSRDESSDSIKALSISCSDPDTIPSSQHYEDSNADILNSLAEDYLKPSVSRTSCPDKTVRSKDTADCWNPHFKRLLSLDQSSSHEKTSCFPVSLVSQEKPKPLYFSSTEAKYSSDRKEKLVASAYHSKKDEAEFLQMLAGQGILSDSNDRESSNNINSNQESLNLLHHSLDFPSSSISMETVDTFLTDFLL